MPRKFRAIHGIRLWLLRLAAPVDSGDSKDVWARQVRGRRGLGAWMCLAHRTEEEFHVHSNIWAYRQNSGHRLGMDLAGFDVEAADGRIGKVDTHDAEADAGHLVVDIGLWIFGKHVLLPVGTISCVDPVERVLYVDRGRDEIKNAPAFDRHEHADDPDYHRRIGAYYMRLTP